MKFDQGKLAMVLRLLQKGAFPEKEALADDDDKCLYCGAKYKHYKVLGESVHLTNCLYGAIEKALRQILELNYFDFVAYGEPGVCSFCEREVQIYGYPADNPAEAYCEKCARKEIEKNIRLAFVASDIFQSLIERYDTDVICDEDLSEALGDGFQEKFGIDPQIFLQFFEKKEAGDLEIIFHKTPAGPGQCLRVIGSGDRVVYVYPDNVAD